MQDPTGHDNTIQGFLPYIEDPAIGLFLNIVVHPSIFPSVQYTLAVCKADLSQIPG